MRIGAWQVARRSFATRVTLASRAITQRPIRAGLLLSAVILAMVSTFTLDSLRNLNGDLNSEVLQISGLSDSSVEHRRLLVGVNDHEIQQIHRLYYVFGIGMATVLGLLLLGFNLAGRAVVSNTIITQQRAIIGRSHDAILQIDLDGTISEHNRAAETMFGYPSHEMVGHAYLDFIAAESREHAKEGFAQSVQLGTNYIEGLHVIRQDGSIAIVDFSTLLVTGERPVVVAIGRDMSEKFLAATSLATSQEQLRQAQKMEALGLLAGGVAHDFNNALTVINGYAELLLDSLPADDANRQRIREIGLAGGRAADITRQLLAFSRRERTQLSITDLNGAIRESATMLGRLLGEDIELETHLGSGLGKILADPGHVQQVLMNLAVNARDAMPGGGRLIIETTMAEGRPKSGSGSSVVRLTFRDTGCGMDAAMQARVFEPFFTTKEAGKGTGLGLSVVFGIVKDSGGVISIESAPGQGATFTIDFPEVIASAAAPVQSAVTAVPAPAAGTILCVEDERPVRDVLHSMLTAQGCTVLTADNGEAALAMSRAHAGSIDLVISDLVMPGLPADEMIAILRAERPSIRVLCISGYSDRARLHPLLMRGDVPFLAKPFTATQLAAALVNALAPTEGSGMRLQS